MEEKEKKIQEIIDIQKKISELFPECVLDSVMQSLKQNFEEILRCLESLSPVLILGNFQGIDIGIRQLIRKKPLETKEIYGIKIPTEAELLRIKAWLITTRNAVRDYVDFIALCDGMQKKQILDAMSTFDECYPQYDAEKSSSQLIRLLSVAQPYDLSGADLKIYKGIEKPYNSWEYVKERRAEVADMLFDKLFVDEGDKNDPPSHR